MSRNRRIVFALMGAALVLLLGLLVPMTGHAQEAADARLGEQYFVESQVRDDRRAVFLPLYEGRLSDGTPLWFILTDASDATTAAAWGINAAPVLMGALGQTRQATIESSGIWVFDAGRVDFAPEHRLVPGADSPFPPSEAQPGAVGDAAYTPLVEVEGVIYNAPIVAFGVTADEIDFCEGNPDRSHVHDLALAICPEEGTVLMRLAQGFGFGREIFYVSPDASDPTAAALEQAIYAPRLGETFGRADAPLFLAINGPRGRDNPLRQGLESALVGEGSPRSLLAEVPGFSNHYSPLWDVRMFQWTAEAIERGYRTQVIDTAYQFPLFEAAGWLTNPAGGAIEASGMIVNCPVIFRAQ